MASFRPSVCLALSAHAHRDSPGGSMRRGQRTFWPHNKEDRHTCYECRSGCVMLSPKTTRSSEGLTQNAPTTHTHHRINRLPQSAEIRHREYACRSSLLRSRNVRWPCRMLPLVSHSEYADGTDRRTDGHQSVALRFPLDSAKVIIRIALKELKQSR